MNYLKLYENIRKKLKQLIFTGSAQQCRAQMINDKNQNPMKLHKSYTLMKCCVYG